MRHSALNERNISICDRYEAGNDTFESIARDYGICGERVRQIWLRVLRSRKDPRGLHGPRLAKQIERLRATNSDCERLA
jgi:hypothetical protein